MQERTCSTCGESKPETLDYFRSRGNSARGGLRPDCRECSARRDREYYERNRDKAIAYRRANVEAISAGRRKTEAAYMATENGRQKRRKALARYAQSDKGKMFFRLAQHRRKARLAQVLNDLTEADWLTVLAEFDYSCAYCGATGDLFQEHVVPIVKGGPNTRTNVVPACRSCNSRKHQKDMEPWFRSHPAFSEARLSAILAHTG